MGDINPFALVKLFVGILFQDTTSLTVVKKDLVNSFGEIDYESKILPFNHSLYYQKEMGDNLKKIFIGFKSLINPEEFYEAKLISNRIESYYLKKNNNRSINIDPGIITLHSIMLLSTKNFSHRIPLRKGIYAEVTLIYQKKSFQDLPWTYPDFKSVQYKNILKELRNLYLASIKRRA